MKVNKKANQVFNIKHIGGYKGIYIPHISLTYDVLNTHKKGEIINYMNQKYKNIKSLNFKVDELQLWDTSGGFKNVKNWKKVKSI